MRIAYVRCELLRQPSVSVQITSATTTSGDGFEVVIDARSVIIGYQNTFSSVDSASYRHAIDAGETDSSNKSHCNCDCNAACESLYIESQVSS